MKPCLYSGACLSPNFCKAGAQECRINAHAEQLTRRDLLGYWGRIGHTYERVVIGMTESGALVSEQMEV